MKWFAGIGSRKIDLNSDEAKLMYKAVYQLAKLGYGMTSGSALGADLLCEQAYRMAIRFGHSNSENIKIFIPWIGFNKTKWSEHHIIPSREITEKALTIAGSLHPNWNNCRHKAKLLHARNVNQVMGEDLKTIVDFVLCWTQDGVEDGTKTTWNTGGTGGAIRLATSLGIPVFNLKNEDAIQRLRDHIRQHPN